MLSVDRVVDGFRIMRYLILSFFLLLSFASANDQSCIKCHTKEHKKWKQSHHYHAIAKATEKTVRGDFNNTSFKNEADGALHEFYRKGKEFWVKITNAKGVVREHKVIYAFGYEPLQQYVIDAGKGHFQCLHVTWNTEKNEWYHLYPSQDLKEHDWLHWSKGSQNMNRMCVECHVTEHEKKWDDKTKSYATAWKIENVSCSACHQMPKDHEKSPKKKTEFKTPHQLVDQCAHCHSRRQRIQEGFKPGDELHDYYEPFLLHEPQYFPDGQILDEVYVYGSFVQSKMYHSKTVSCTNCHDSHTYKLKMKGNALCTQCHTPDQYDSPKHHFHKNGTEGASCVNCHMDGRNYMGHDYRRDHSFRIPDPAISLKHGTPNACNSCHQDKDVAWSLKALKDRGKYKTEGSIHQRYADLMRFQATAEEYLKFVQDENVQVVYRATLLSRLTNYPLNQIQVQKLLAYATKHKELKIRLGAVKGSEQLPLPMRQQFISPLATDKIKAIRLEVGRVMADLPKAQQSEDMKKVIKEYSEYLAYVSDFRSGQAAKGLFRWKQGQSESAVKAFERSLEIDPFFDETRMNLAVLYSQLGKTDLALQKLDELLANQPNFGDAYYYKGLLLAEQKRTEAALANFEKADKIMSSPTIYYNWIALLLQDKQKTEAQQLWLKAVQKFPMDQRLKSLQQYLR